MSDYASHIQPTGNDFTARQRSNSARMEQAFSRVLEEDAAMQEPAAQKAARAQNLQQQMEAHLQETQAAPLTEQQAGEAIGYCNRALENIDRLRHPVDLPTLGKKAEVNGGSGGASSTAGGVGGHSAAGGGGANMKALSGTNRNESHAGGTIDDAISGLTSSEPSGTGAYTDNEKTFLKRFQDLDPTQRKEKLKGLDPLTCTRVKQLIERNFDDALKELPPEARDHINSAGQEKALARQQEYVAQYGGSTKDYEGYANPGYYRAVEAGNYMADSSINGLEMVQGQLDRGERLTGASTFTPRSISARRVIEASSMMKSISQ